MVIAVVGAGGKTTLIKRMAKEYLAENKSVLITTSTHMFWEEETLVTDDPKEIIDALEKKRFCFAGREAEDKEAVPESSKDLSYSKTNARKKITALSPKTYEEVCSHSDVVLIEADGSRGLPLKFPNETEPVIYGNVDEIIVVFGIHSLGRKVKDVVHRWELVKDFLSPDATVTLECIQLLIQKGYIEPLRKQYPDKKITLYGSHENPLYGRVVTSLMGQEDMLGVIKEEWFCPQPKLVILGGGHVSVKLAKMAGELDFTVKVMDDREEFVNKERFPYAEEIICDSFANLERYLEPDAYYVVVTRGHKDDFECVKKILSAKYAYLGMIGSRLKVEKTLENLEKEGFSREQLDTVFAPIGLDIQAVTPGEIAISILAQIIREKNKRHVASASKKLLECEKEGVLCVIIEKTGSSPRGVGSMMLVTGEEVIDSIGGGAVEFAAIEDARNCKEVMVKEYHLNNKDSERLGMICGGSNKVLFVPI